MAISAQPIAGVSTSGLIFGNGASIDYGKTDNHGTLSINGQSYTLIYQMTDLDAIDGVNAVTGLPFPGGIFGPGPGGNYALATNLDASGTTYTQAPIGSFSGQFDGLGHTITGLTITGGPSSPA